MKIMMLKIIADRIRLMIAFWALMKCVSLALSLAPQKKGESTRLANVKLRLNIENEMHAVR